MGSCAVFTACNSTLQLQAVGSLQEPNFLFALEDHSLWTHKPTWAKLVTVAQGKKKQKKNWANYSVKRIQLVIFYILLSINPMKRLKPTMCSSVSAPVCSWLGDVFFNHQQWSSMEQKNERYPVIVGFGLFMGFVDNKKKGRLSADFSFNCVDTASFLYHIRLSFESAIQAY